MHSIIVCGLLSLVAALGSACVASNASRCGNDLICPSGKTCSPSGESCVDADLVAACRAVEDGQSCNVPGLPAATCAAGVCQASRCGDGRVTGGEQCDGSALKDQTCQTFGFYDKAGLRCNAECRLDTSQCVGRCGDGVKNGREQCDGVDLAGATCFAIGFHNAAGLACKADCTFDSVGCGGGRCGDGKVNGLEQCDGGKANRSCNELGFPGASSGIQCTPTCQFSTESCLCGAVHCAARTERCECPKLGGCGCVAVR